MKGIQGFISGANQYGPKALSTADAGVKSSATGVAGSLASAGGGIGDKLMMTGNPYAMAGGAVLKFASGMSDAMGKVREWGDHLHEQNRTFAEFSGSMAAVMAQDDARRIWLQREQGERRAQSAKDLAEARFRLDATLAPLEDAFAKLKNQIVAGLSDSITNAIKKIDRVGFFNQDDAGAYHSTEGHLWMESFLDEERKIEKRRPKRMQ